MNETSKKFLYSIAAILLAYNMTGCMEEDTEKEQVTFNPSNYIHESVEEKKPEIELYYDTDTIDEEEEISKLGIIEDEINPTIMYKAIQYVDRNQIERIGIVETHIKYNVDENKNIESEYYEVYDVFNGNYLFSCDNFDFISNDKVLYLVSYGSIDKLKDIVIKKGMNRDYVESVYSSIKNKNSLSLSEVARVYVLLVNSTNRLNNEMQLKMSNN